jgi:hypothetical protein
VKFVVALNKDCRSSNTDARQKSLETVPESVVNSTKIELQLLHIHTLVFAIINNFNVSPYLHTMLS